MFYDLWSIESRQRREKFFVLQTQTQRTQSIVLVSQTTRSKREGAGAFSSRRSQSSGERRREVQRDDYIILYLYGNAPGEMYKSHIHIHVRSVGRSEERQKRERRRDEMHSHRPHNHDVHSHNEHPSSPFSNKLTCILAIYMTCMSVG